MWFFIFFIYFFYLSCTTAEQADHSWRPLVLGIFYFYNRGSWTRLTPRRSRPNDPTTGDLRRCPDERHATTWEAGRDNPWPACILPASPTEGKPGKRHKPTEFQKPGSEGGHLRPAEALHRARGWWARGPGLVALSNDGKTGVGPEKGPYLHLRWFFFKFRFDISLLTLSTHFIKGVFGKKKKKKLRKLFYVGILLEIEYCEEQNL